MTDTVALWSRRDWGGPDRDDKAAIAEVADDIAVLGYIVDRLREVTAERIGNYWKYIIPVRRVTA